MLLFLMRHGIPESAAAGGDSARALTAEGKAQVRAVLTRAAEWIESLDVIVTSPYVRAKETAKIAAEVFRGARVVEADLVVPHGNPSQFSDWALKNLRGSERVLIASHMPYLGLLAGELLDGRKNAPVGFEKAGLACIEWDPPGGGAVLHWLVQPDQVLG